MNTFRFHLLLLLLGLTQVLCALPSALQTTSTPNTSQPTVPPVKTPGIDPGQVVTAINLLIPPVMQANQVSACSVAVAYPDVDNGALQTTLINFGTLTNESKVPVNSTTEYEIGSLSKLFTADLLALLVQDGKMQLDDPVQKYLPSNVHVPTYNGQSITLRQLATHTSGLPRTMDSVQRVRKVNGVSVNGYVTDKEIFDFLNSYQLTRAPGDKWEYSNLANAILGMAEEQVANDSYENLVIARITTPLGLNNTRVTLSAEEKTNLALSAPQNGKASPSFATNGEMLAAGGLRSTIQDQAIYLVDNIDPAGTNLNTILSMTQQQQDKGNGPNMVMGLGWKIESPGTPQEQFDKAGSTAGYNSYITFSRVTRSGFVLLCNGQLVMELAPQINKIIGGSDTSVDGSE
jgi:serine-type D-Ala-D-Ala carboxypeptidase/endopeptidase